MLNKYLDCLKNEKMRVKSNQINSPVINGGRTEFPSTEPCEARQRYKNYEVARKDNVKKPGRSMSKTAMTSAHGAKRKLGQDPDISTSTDNDDQSPNEADLEDDVMSATLTGQRSTHCRWDAKSGSRLLPDAETSTGKNYAEVPVPQYRCSGEEGQAKTADRVIKSPIPGYESDLTTYEYEDDEGL
ncbi:hypothetical protein BDQ12DRAFT_669685 [Crucibulum laeve]|uniref:Uncharacterized protein n=1 Tax=Crucibulum laeve TaxID=68775 RepID=A0A5C3LLS9_9AGAR|nr:hypothetical protein BDQ12DRAFT_669685 [Crucibulum laeve]